VELPRRVGAEKVQRLFGVRPIDRTGLRRMERIILQGVLCAFDIAFAQPVGRVLKAKIYDVLRPDTKEGGARHAEETIEVRRIARADFHRAVNTLRCGK